MKYTTKKLQTENVELKIISEYIPKTGKLFCIAYKEGKRHSIKDNDYSKEELIKL